MGLRPDVTQVAVTAIFGGVFETCNLPARYSVTFTARLTEAPGVLVKMTCRAQQLIIQDSMIHDGDRASEHMVLLMTNQAILFCLMKRDFLFKAFLSRECVASEALLGRYALPWFVAHGAILNTFVKDAESTWLSSGIVKEKPSGKREHETVTQYLIPFSHRNHLKP